MHSRGLLRDCENFADGSFTALVTLCVPGPVGVGDGEGDGARAAGHPQQPLVPQLHQLRQRLDQVLPRRAARLLRLGRAEAARDRRRGVHVGRVRQQRQPHSAHVAARLGRGGAAVVAARDAEHGGGEAADPGDGVPHAAARLPSPAHQRPRLL